MVATESIGNPFCRRLDQYQRQWGAIARVGQLIRSMKFLLDIGESFHLQDVKVWALSGLRIS